MQNISSFDQFILEIQQILESQDLKDHTLFDQLYEKILK